MLVLYAGYMEHMPKCFVYGNARSHMGCSALLYSGWIQSVYVRKKDADFCLEFQRHIPRQDVQRLLRLLSSDLRNSDIAVHRRVREAYDGLLAPHGVRLAR